MAAKNYEMSTMGRNAKLFLSKSVGSQRKREMGSSELASDDQLELEIDNNYFVPNLGFGHLNGPDRLEP